MREHSGRDTKAKGERRYKGARKWDEMAKPPRKTGIAGFGTVHKPFLWTPELREIPSRRQIWSKWTPIDSKICRDVSRGVGDVLPEDQYPETPESKQISKSISKRGFSQLFLQDMDLSAHKEFAKTGCRYIPQES